MMELEWVQILGLVLVHFIWQGLLIGLLYGAGRVLSRTCSATARYNWAVMCLMLMALAPVVTFFWLSSSSAELAAPGLLATSHSVAVEAAAATPASLGLTLTPLLPWVVALWLSGVVLMSTRLGAGWWQVYQLRRRANYAVPAPIRAHLVRLASQLELSGSIGLAVSNRIAGPMLVGLARPLILLPAGLVNGLSARQIEMVLAHELSHLKRADHLVNFFQNVVETLLFYHPVVRWISNEIRAERELVSDELAAHLTGDRIAYAETLLHLEKVRGDRLPMAIGMADHQILTRVRHLFSVNSRQSGSVVSGMTVLIVFLVSVVAALISTGLPSFSNGNESGVSAPVLIEQSMPATMNDAETIERSRAETSPSVASAPPYPVPMDPLAPVVEEERPVVEVVDAIGEVAAPVVEEQIVLASIESPIEAVSDPVEIEQVAQPPPSHDIDPVVAEPEASPVEELKMAALIAPAPVAEFRGGALVKSQVPDYPATAIRARREGHAEVRLTVDPDGRVVDAAIIEESPRGYGFGEAALQAVRQWQFEPFTRDGRPVRHELSTGFDFTDPPECGRVTGTRISRC
jgi:bla regulator protein blaR1